MRRFSVLLPALAPALVPLTACYDAPVAPPAAAVRPLVSYTSTLRTERGRLLAVDLLFGGRFGPGSAARPIADGVTRLFASDVVYLQAGLPIVQGRDAARAAMLALPNAATTVLSWRPLRGDVSADGKHGYTYGGTELRTANPDGTTTVDFGRYIAFWEKGGDNRWRIAAYVRNRSPAFPGEQPAGFESPTDKTYPSFPIASVAAERTVLLGVDAAFAAASISGTVADAFAAYVAPDGAALSGPEILYGPAAIHAFFDAGVPPGDQLDWTPEIADVAASGDLGFTVGNSAYRTTDETGAPLAFYSKYLTIWKKQRDGQWKFVVDGGNGSPPPAP